ncbi:Nramp-domain-containing protein [Lentinula edodes]|uniref:Nramp-domain-containing protein n=1 Tax=Lentinula edodes TaxID=5353 RepID=A0A1Q3EBZ0_LENED|nr:Nramp-domain-containing protein [Lentinula edodes]
MPTLQPTPVRSGPVTLRTILKSVLHHVKRHVGIGIVCSVAYFDPGNWSVDLQAGANFGYRPMLFVLLLSGLGAMVLQTLACKLGCVTGIDLASHCRLLLHDHPTHPRLSIRINNNDIGYIPDKKLFQSHPNALYAAVGILGATIMPHALFLGSFLATQDREAFHKPTPANLPEPSNRKKLKRNTKTYFMDLFRITPAERAAAAKDYRSRYGVRENNSLSFVKQHLNHIVIDVCSSILVFAVPINSAILILSATVFFDKLTSKDMAGVTIGLFDAHALIHARIGSGSAFLFALALVVAGQSSSITATLAGQVVGEGFIEWRVSPFLRRLLTRSISLIPSVVVAVAVGRNGIDNLLIISQVLLSVALPFVAFPLIYLTSSKVVMRVQKPPSPPSAVETFDFESTSVHAIETAADSSEPSLRGSIQEVDVEESINSSRNSNGTPTHKSEIEEISDAISIDNIEYIDYSNSRLMSALAYLIWAVILITNVYTMVALGLGDT